MRLSDPMSALSTEDDIELLELQPIASKEQVESCREQMRKLPDFCKFFYCNLCQRVMPPRSDHCQMCGVCNLRVDHHCIWVGNCVAVQNHKFFLLYLFYKVLALTLSASVFLFRCQTADFGFLDLMFESPSGMVVMLLSITLALGLGLLLVVSLRMASQNRTMMELGFGITRNHYVKPTLVQNLKVIFGQGCLLMWLSPFHRAYPENLSVHKSQLLDVVCPQKLN